MSKHTTTDWALEMREAILHAPLAYRGVVDAALADCTAEDLDALRSWRNAGLVTGDWRRAAINRRIAELETGSDK